MAYNFTAASQHHLTTPDTSSLDITGALTLCAWVKSSGSYGTAARGVLTKYETATNNRSYGIAINSSGKITFLIGGGTGAFSVTGATTIGTGWRHISGAFTPSAKSEVFLDGVTNGINSTDILTSLFSGTAPLAVGMISVSSVNNCWDGQIAEAAVYNAALTAAEIASLAKGTTCDKIRPQSLVFYAPLVRDLQDTKGGLAITNNNGATVANHPRIYP